MEENVFFHLFGTHVHIYNSNYCQHALIHPYLACSGVEMFFFVISQSAFGSGQGLNHWHINLTMSTKTKK